MRLAGCTFRGTQGSDVGIGAAATVYTDSAAADFKLNPLGGGALRPLSEAPAQPFITLDDPALLEIKRVRDSLMSRDEQPPSCLCVLDV